MASPFVRAKATLPAEEKSECEQVHKKTAYGKKTAPPEVLNALVMPHLALKATL